MRGHGFTVQGVDIVDVVHRAVYTQQNATIQTTALLTRAAHFGPIHYTTEEDTAVRYLSGEESQGATQMTKWWALRSWRLWSREVEAQELYVNVVLKGRKSKQLFCVIFHLRKRAFTYSMSLISVKITIPNGLITG
ncbi:hypothetical protein M433DRAFT_146338 [Acidomyces richmondensis BFW]|nr:MAG: hypothetical protein FE78DRAFT_83525 [Acidomyces sp. 'richmondensis']KYG42925.1 hypothetical protein M433DRAFT_146338 [Acidomyces richmondensis BFW]